MNVEELLDLMEETLEAGTAVPFAPAKRVVDVDRMRDIIDEVRNNLPDEIRESKKIVNDREQIMKNARGIRDHHPEGRGARRRPGQRAGDRQTQPPARRRDLDRSQHPGKGFDQKCNGVL